MKNGKGTDEYFYTDKRYTQIAKWIIEEEDKIINNTKTVLLKTGSAKKAYQYFYSKLPKVHNKGLKGILNNTMEIDGRNKVSKRLFNKVFERKQHYTVKVRENPKLKRLDDFFN